MDQAVGERTHLLPSSSLRDNNRETSHQKEVNTSPQQNEDVDSCYVDRSRSWYSVRSTESQDDARDNTANIPRQSSDFRDRPIPSAGEGALSASGDGSQAIDEFPRQQQAIDQCLHVAACQESNQTSRCGVICLLLVIFFQGLGAREIGTILNNNNKTKYDFVMTEQDKNVIRLSFGATVYILPIVAGLISDTILPRQRALLLAIIMKFVGSLLSFSSILIAYDGHRLKDWSNDVIGFLKWVHVLGLTLVLLALCFFPLIISFGAQQMDQSNRHNISAYLRWMFFTVGLGALTSTGVHKLGIIEAFPKLMLVIGDALSLVVFLVAIKKYNTSSTEKGSKRFKEFVDIVRSYVPCFCPRRDMNEANDLWGNLDRIRDIQDKKIMDRLHLRKGILVVAMLSCGAVAASMYYAMNMSVSFISDLYPTRHDNHIIGYLKVTTSLMMFLTIILMEVLTWCSKYLANVINNNIFKKLGLGSLLAAFACLIGGLVNTGIWRDGADKVPIWWLLPQSCIIGIAGGLILISVCEIGFFESGPGLATFLCGLGASLSFISFTVSGIILESTDIHSLRRFDFIYYILFGVMVFTLLVIYIPVSIWYTGVKVQIASFSISIQERAGHSGASNQTDEQVGLPETSPQRLREMQSVTMCS